MKYRCISAFQVLAYVVVIGTLAVAGFAGQSPTAAARQSSLATKPWTPPSHQTVNLTFREAG